MARRRNPRIASEVKISWLPGFEPPEPPPAPRPLTRFPFEATINDERVIVWPDWIEYLEEDDEDDPDPLSQL